ncbi:MAG TPA: zinc-dependent metalloprotease [Candidatus Dormibacteraeota bacterium]
MKAKVARGVAFGILSGIAAAAVMEATRPLGGKASVIDWDAVRRHARRHLREDWPMPAEERERLAGEYARLAADVRRPLFDVVGGPTLEFSPFTPLGRIEWIDLNVEIIRRVLDPVIEEAGIPRSRLTDAGQVGIDRYTGTVLSFLSSRVLGQFDPQLMGREPVAPTGLYLVEPNVAQWQAEAGLPGDDLRRWLILHETTHAWQFQAHPWLVQHMNAALEEILALAGHRRQGAARLLSLTVGLPGQWATVRRMQATMSLIEGYSNLVMTLAGRRVLDSYDALEAAYRKRSDQKSPLEALFWKLTGLDLKLQQYRNGEAFSRAVYEAHGMATLNLAWESAENLPRAEELGRPEKWVSRVTRGTRRLSAPATA